MLGSEVVLSGPTALRRSHSMSCMTQLQAKHSGTPFDQLDGTAGSATAYLLCYALLLYSICAVLCCFDLCYLLNLCCTVLCCGALSCGALC